MGLLLLLVALLLLLVALLLLLVALLLPTVCPHFFSEAMYSSRATLFSRLLAGSHVVSS